MATAVCSSEVTSVKTKNPFPLTKILDEEDKKLKLRGILKRHEKISGTLVVPSSLDFTNECRISNLIQNNTGIPSRNMDSNMEHHQVLTVKENEDDNSYFIATSTTTPQSTWISKPERAFSPTRSETGTSTFHGNQMTSRGGYFGNPATHISRYNGGKCQSNCSGRTESHSITRRLIFRFFQITSLLLIVMGIATLVSPLRMPEWDQILVTNETSATENLTSADLHALLEQWATENSQGPTSSSFLDLPSLTYSLNNYQLCATNQNSSGVYFLILIHSAPTHFVERQAIRGSWGSVKTYKNWSIRLVFLLGQLPSPDTAIQEGILGESDLYGDIVAGNFDDTYRNLTYKHLMGYKWVLSHCPLAKFVIKTDDDAFIDIFQVFDFAQRNYGLNPTDILLCNIYPEGTLPVRNSSEQNSEGYKWLVTTAEYPFDAYPKYCGGLGYLVTVDVVRQLTEIGDRFKRFLWIDDVFVTGVIRELAGKEPFYLNLRYSYDEQEYRTWLDDRNPRHRLKKLPYMFVHVPRGRAFNEEMARLWRKTVRAWS